MMCISLQMKQKKKTDYALRLITSSVFWSGKTNQLLFHECCLTIRISNYFPATPFMQAHQEDQNALMLLSAEAISAKITFHPSRGCCTLLNTFSSMLPVNTCS